MAKGKIKTLKIVSQDGKAEFQNWYVETPTIGSPFPEYDSNQTWDKWGEDTFGMGGEQLSVVSDETEF